MADDDTTGALTDEALDELRRCQDEALEYGRRGAIGWISPALAFAGLAFDCGLLAEVDRLREENALIRLMRKGDVMQGWLYFDRFNEAVGQIERLRSLVDALHGAAWEAQSAIAALVDALGEDESGDDVTSWCVACKIALDSTPDFRAWIDGGAEVPFPSMPHKDPCPLAQARAVIGHWPKPDARSLLADFPPAGPPPCGVSPSAPRPYYCPFCGDPVVGLGWWVGALEFCSSRCQQSWANVRPPVRSPQDDNAVASPEFGVGAFGTVGREAIALPGPVAGGNERDRHLGEETPL